MEDPVIKKKVESLFGFTDEYIKFLYTRDLKTNLFGIDEEPMSQFEIEKKVAILEEVSAFKKRYKEIKNRRPYERDEVQIKKRKIEEERTKTRVLCEETRKLLIEAITLSDSIEPEPEFINDGSLEPIYDLEVSTHEIHKHFTILEIKKKGIIKTDPFNSKVIGVLSAGVGFKKYVSLNFIIKEYGLEKLVKFFYSKKGRSSWYTKECKKELANILWERKNKG